MMRVEKRELVSSRWPGEHKEHNNDNFSSELYENKAETNFLVEFAAVLP